MYISAIKKQEAKLVFNTATFAISVLHFDVTKCCFFFVQNLTSSYVESRDCGSTAIKLYNCNDAEKTSSLFDDFSLK